MRRKILDQNGFNYLTLTIVDWVDVFTRKECRDIVLESLRHCQAKKGLVIYAYVIMSNHIHLVVQAAEAHCRLDKDKR
jgi:REP element-mobilizing transposase RayT